MTTHHPTQDEQQQFKISSFKGIEIGLGQADPVASISAGKYVRGRYLHRLRQHEQQGYDKSEALAAYGAMFSHTGSTIYRKAAA